MPEKKWTIPRIIIMSIIGFIALLWILVGAIALLGGEIITFSYALAFWILPAIFVASCFFTLRSKLRSVFKILICLFLFAAILVQLFWTLAFGHFIFDYSDEAEGAIAEYQAAAQNCSAFPEVSQLGQYTNVEFHNYIDHAFFYFTAESNILICQYDDAEYQSQKDRLEENFVFQMQPVTATDYTCDSQFSIDNYAFRMLSFEEDTYSQLYYPHHIFFIVTNDVTNEIIYLEFSDYDLDYIVSMRDHILTDCGWKYIR